MKQVTQANLIHIAVLVACDLLVSNAALANVYMETLFHIAAKPSSYPVTRFYPYANSKRNMMSYAWISTAPSWHFLQSNASCCTASIEAMSQLRAAISMDPWWCFGLLSGIGDEHCSQRLKDILEKFRSAKSTAKWHTIFTSTAQVFGRQAHLYLTPRHSIF